MKPPHVDTSEKVVAYLSRIGLSAEVQQRLGVFQTTWGLFETHLELCIWRLRNDDVTGERPWTDKTPVSNWIDELGKGWPDLPSEINDILGMSSLAARDLMNYRHAVFHGWLMSLAEMPSFVRNPGWHGEIRKRPSSVAHVGPNLLDMAIDANWSLFQAVFWMTDAVGNETIDRPPDSLKQTVQRARSYANELCHLSELMNFDKY